MAHQRFRHFPIAPLNGGHNQVVFLKRLLAAVEAGLETEAVKPHEVVQVLTQHANQASVFAALNNGEVEIEVNILLGVVLMLSDFCLVACQNLAQTLQFLFRHVLSG